MIHPLKAFRLANGKSQRELASLLRVTRVTVARWETGMREIDLPLLPLIFRKTGIAPCELRPDISKIMRLGAAP